MIPVRTATLITALLLAPLALQANTDLTVKLERTKIPVKDLQTSNAANEPPAKQIIHLTLGNRWVQWDDGSDRGVYDFGKRVVIRVDRASQRLDEASLYALLSGRMTELDNRLMLGSALQAGKVAENPMAPTMAEHQLSLRHSAERVSGIERSIAGDEQRYLWQKKELFAFSKELVPLPAASRELYLRFVRYSVGGHPEIFDDLQKLDGVPKWLRYSDPFLGDVQRIDVVSVKQTADAPYSLPSLPKTTLKNTEAAKAAAAVTSSTPESRAAAAARILAAANAAANSGKALEAMLGYIELQLMTGEMPADFRNRTSVIVQDENVRALSGALNANSEALARGAVGTLTRLAPLAGSKAYVTGIFRANMETSLGNGQAAIGLLTTALTKNPFLTGVWKDLGDAFDTGYDAVDTWRCYETARHIAPEHGLLAPIAGREAALLKDHPEFF